MVSTKAAEIYRKDAQASGKLLTVEERERLLRPYLPAPIKKGQSKPNRRTKPVRTFAKVQVHVLLFNLMHLFFSVYLRLRQICHAILHRISAILYYHHRTPELIRRDIKGLSRLPQHLSIILELSADNKGREGLDRLLDDVAEVSAWCASAGIPFLGIYEKTGILKSYISTTHRAVASKLHAYFGKGRPSLQVRAPNMPTFLNGDVSEDSPNPAGLGMLPPAAAAAAHGAESLTRAPTGHLALLLLSADDGRSTLVDLTKTLVEMSQHNKLASKDISQEVIDAEISESVMSEPDLLILFSPIVKLNGYPPWQLRLTEIFHVEDNNGVEYLVWLKGLYSLAKAQMRFGR